jgi:type IV pilus assembly protein PilO
MAAAEASRFARITTPMKLGAAAVFMVVAAAGYWIGFYSETAGKIESAKRQKDQLQTELVQKQQAYATYLKERDELSVRQQRARDFEKVLPDDTQEAAFLYAIDQATKTAGLALDGYKPLEEQVKAFYAKVPMKLDIRGRFHQVVKFIYELGKSDRIINVENIELLEPKLVGDEVQLKGSCLATAFHAVKAKSPGKPPAPGAPK